MKPVKRHRPGRQGSNPEPGTKRFSEPLFCACGCGQKVTPGRFRPKMYATRSCRQRVYDRKLSAATGYAGHDRTRTWLLRRLKARREDVIGDLLRDLAWEREHA